MSRASDRLREFHEAFDCCHGKRERLTLHREEHAELIEALVRLPEQGTHRRDRLAAVARELADVMVIVYGTAERLGIDLDAAFEAVMDANMAKLPSCSLCAGTGMEPVSGGCLSCNGTGKGKPIKRHDGKVMKPGQWREPDMSVALRGEPDAR